MTKKLTELQIEKIIKIYKDVDGNALNASKILNISNTTILKYWKLNGLNSCGKSISKNQRKSIIDEYHNSHGNCSEIKRKTGFYFATIKKYLKEEGFETSATKDIPLCDVEKIINGHKKYHGGICEFTKTVNYTYLTIKKIWDEVGLKPNGGYKGYSSALEYFRKASRLETLTRYELSLADPGLYRKLGRDGDLETAIPETVTPNRGKKNLSLEKQWEIVELYKKNITKKSALNYIDLEIELFIQTIKKYLKKQKLPISIKDRKEMFPEYFN